MKYIMNRLLAVFLTLMFFLVLKNCYTQNSIGITLGVNISKINYEYSGAYWKDYEPNAESIKNPYLGFRIENLFGESENIKGMFQTGLFVSFSGSEEKYRKHFSVDTTKNQIAQEYYDLGYDTVSIEKSPLEATLNHVYLEVPLNFGIYFKGIKIFTGPYFRIGINGKYKQKVNYKIYASTYDGISLPQIDESYIQTENYKVQFEASGVEKTGFEEDKVYYYFFDFGFNYGIGYQYKSLLLSLHYSMGLQNIVSEVEGYIDPKDVIQENRIYNISISLLF